MDALDVEHGDSSDDEFVEDDHASKTTDVDVGLLFHEGDGVEAEWVGEYV